MRILNNHCSITSSARYIVVRSLAKAQIALAIVAMTQASRAQTPPPVNYQPSPLYGAGDKGERRIPLVEQGVKCTASYSIEDHTVSLWWAWTSTGPRPQQYSVQVEAVSFWPTDVIGAGNDRLLVSGRRRNGNTVIELWQLGTIPTLSPRQDASGVWHYPEMVVPIKTKKTVFDESTTGRALVGSMFWNPVTAPQSDVSLFAIFEDSRDLCRIDLHTDGSNSVQRLYSKLSGTGVPQIAALSCQQRQLWSGNNTQSGYVYVLSNLANSGGACQMIVLLDRNRDGVIDSDGVLTPTEAEWKALALWDASKFSEFY